MKLDLPPRMVFTISSAVVAVIAISALAVALIALPVDKDEVETLVRDYLRDHPEAVVEAIRQFQTNEEAVGRDRTEAALVTLRPQVERDPASPRGRQSETVMSLWSSSSITIAASASGSFPRSCNS